MLAILTNFFTVNFASVPHLPMLTTQALVKVQLISIYLNECINYVKSN